METVRWSVDTTMESRAQFTLSALSVNERLSGVQSDCFIANRRDRLRKCRVQIVTISLGFSSFFFADILRIVWRFYLLFLYCRLRIIGFPERRSVVLNSHSNRENTHFKHSDDSVEHRKYRGDNHTESSFGLKCRTGLYGARTAGGSRYRCRPVYEKWRYRDFNARKRRPRCARADSKNRWWFITTRILLNENRFVLFVLKRAHVTHRRT